MVPINTTKKWARNEVRNNLEVVAGFCHFFVRLFFRSFIDTLTPWHLFFKAGKFWDSIKLIQPNKFCTFKKRCQRCQSVRIIVRKTNNNTTSQLHYMCVSWSWSHAPIWCGYFHTHLVKMYANQTIHSDRKHLIWLRLPSFAPRDRPAPSTRSALSPTLCLCMLSVMVRVAAKS